MYGRLKSYKDDYLNDYGFESVMVSYRKNLLVERLNIIKPKIVVEIGCGSELLYADWLLTGASADLWVIVEPVNHFVEMAKGAKLPNLCVVEGLLENTARSLLGILPRKPDLIVCSCLLHEVDSASAFLLEVCKLMGPDTILHINVPNSESFHRLLALRMGLIENTKTMSSRNTMLNQRNVYDINSLTVELLKADMSIVAEGGYFIKPFTHAQMEIVSPMLGGAVVDGLFELGKIMPELASEIWVEATLNDCD